MNKNFSIFKVKEKKTTNSPDYYISMKIGEKYMTVGSGWMKEGKGGKYISCKLSDGYQTILGYHIQRDEPTIAEKTQVAKEIGVKDSEIPF